MSDLIEENACPNCESANPIGKAFCSFCGTKLTEQDDSQTKNQPLEDQGSKSSAIAFLKERPKVLVVGTIALVVILIAALVVGLSGSNQSAPLTAVQRNCEAPAGAYVAQMLSAGPMNSNEISNDLIGAMERFGQSSTVYHAISDAESQAIAIEVQQGEKAAVLQAAQIIKADCTNSVSSSGASGTSQSGSSSSSGPASAISPTTTSNGNLNDNTNGGTNNSSGVSGNTGSPNQTPYAPPTTTTIPEVEVPDLIGKSVPQSTSLLQSSNLELGNVLTGAPDPNGVCVGDNTTENIPSGYVEEYSVRGSSNASYAPAGSIVDVTVCP
jgi:hypothetical protein